MIDIAREKMLHARFIQYDFTQGLPDCLNEGKFDFIVCTYAIPHLKHAQQIRFVKALTGRLSPGGSVLIGDVAFETGAELEQCRAQNKSAWDSDEIYPIAELFRLKSPLLQFEMISSRSGVLRFPR